MPLMIPDDIEQFTTPGEEAFYRFLSSVAKPDERFLVWYSPDINESEPDFILYCPDVGLIVFEVKDWTIDQIREVSPKKFLVAFGSKEISCTNPHEQAKGYVFNILDHIASDGLLVTKQGFAQGKPKIPVSHGVVFPNINSHEYLERFNNDAIIPIPKIFFWDHLHPYSDLHDPTGHAFLAAIRERFEPKFPCHISAFELNHLRRLLYPTIRITPVERAPSEEFKNHEENVRLLDHHQEIIARKFDGGHRIISGPSGSGKTLVLVHQAVFLQKYNPRAKRILFLCYNTTLVNYIRRLLAANGASLGSDGIEVLQFFDLCSRITGEPVVHENEEPLYYDLVIEEALAKGETVATKYDAILIDEAQDFSNSMLQVVMRVLNREVDILSIALDEGQDLYGKTRVWSDAGIQIRGRKRQLNIIYRNTKEIAEFANRFRYGTAPGGATATPQQSLFPDPRISRGPVPVVAMSQSLSDLVAKVVNTICKLSESEMIPFSEIAILYARKMPYPEMTKSLPVLLQISLDQHGVMSKWLSEDYRAKRQHDITANSVTISTIHSAKGLDFGCVFLLGLDTLDSGGRWGEEQVKSLCYVGMTRARFRLEIHYVEATPLVQRVLAAIEAV
ncbi:NERD domain-containing protein [Geomonas nitrogeniifigens]|uniref:3'-5' exonuclease n=1 Tax=Geomonas diazotrophica TaxID=2843197 RepID=UPI001C2BEDAC|nr:nuclease-related domain-containing DEAD/DEAH box helicase [Geomonas nitrogeniifigens]QXE87397.1 NERD domain-containing protein [Geomonas nitrogeniifigens]